MKDLKFIPTVTVGLRLKAVLLNFSIMKIIICAW